MVTFAPRRSRFLLLAALAVPGQAQTVFETARFRIDDSPASQGYGLELCLEDGVVLSTSGIHSTPRTLYALDAATGAELWHRSTPAGLDDGFGEVLDADAGRLAMGISRSGPFPQGPTPGAVEILDLATGALLRELRASDGETADLFGHSVSLSGDLILVGAPGCDEAATDSGAAYVFDVVTGAELHKLTPSDGALEDAFGTSVALHGNLAVIGVPEDDHYPPACDFCGSAYVFDVTTGQELYKLRPSDAQYEHRFGTNVAINDSYVVVTTRKDSDSGWNSGSAYVFDALTGAELMELIPADAKPQDRFGHSIAVEGNVLVVGAPDHLIGGIRSGAAYAFDLTSGAELAKFLPSDRVADQHCGHAVDVDGGRFLVGSPDDVHRAFIRGTLTLYDPANTSLAVPYCECAEPVCANLDRDSGCRNSSGSGARLLPGGSASVTADDLRLALVGAVPGQFGIVFRGGAQLDTPFGDGRLCVGAGGAALCRLPPRLVGPDGSFSVGPGLVAAGQSLPAPCRIDAGETWHFQAWFRDPAGPCGSGFALSAALSVSFVP